MWPAALTLLQHLRDHPESLPRGARVLELGAGTGWMALKAREFRPDLREWCATEMRAEGAVDRLARNLNLAKDASAAPAASASTEPSPTVALRAEPLDWALARRSPLVDEPWDVVLGSDLVYGEDGATHLAACLAAFLEPRPAAEHEPSRKEGDEPSPSPSPSPSPRRRCLVAQTCGRWGGYGFDAALYAALARENLRAVAVGGETMRGSDERRQHVVVFEVSPRKRDSRGDASAAAADDDDDGDVDDGDEDEAGHHVLLRARRLHLAAEAAAEAAMTEEERMEMEAARLFEET